MRQLRFGNLPRATQAAEAEVGGPGICDRAPIPGFVAPSNCWGKNPYTYIEVDI